LSWSFTHCALTGHPARVFQSPHIDASAMHLSRGTTAAVLALVDSHNPVEPANYF
jgi:hypothetical protein